VAPLKHKGRRKEATAFLAGIRRISIVPFFRKYAVYSVFGLSLISKNLNLRWLFILVKIESQLFFQFVIISH
jgi:hypothetical protein